MDKIPNLEKDRYLRPKSILVVDDDPTNLRMLQEILKISYKVYAAPSGERALAFLEKHVPDLILLDVEMPGMSGYEVISRLKESSRWHSIPVIFLTAQEGREKEEKAFSLGAVDYIQKPIMAGIVNARVNLHLELESYRKSLENLVESKTIQLQRTQDSILDILGNITGFRDSGTGGHITRTTIYSHLLAENLVGHKNPSYVIPQEYADHITKSSKLHDIGKVAIPDSILHKPARLTPEEFETIKLHTTYGAQFIDDAIADLGDDSSFLHIAREIVIAHHEWWDGAGYPCKLAGEQIPISARIMAISDVYDSLISSRPYKGTMPHSEAMGIIYKETGNHFDPTLVEISRDVFDEFEKIAAHYQD